MFSNLLRTYTWQLYLTVSDFILHHSRSKATSPKKNLIDYLLYYTIQFGSGILGFHDIEFGFSLVKMYLKLNSLLEWQMEIH